MKKNKQQIPKLMWAVLILGVMVLLLATALFSVTMKCKKDKLSETPTLVDYLIEEEIYFIYSSGCHWCEKQIEVFGPEDWGTYNQTGLTIDCAKFLVQVCGMIRSTPSWIKNYTLIGEGLKNTIEEFG